MHRVQMCTKETYAGRNVLGMCSFTGNRRGAQRFEAACAVALARGDAPRVQLGADPADRGTSERAKRPDGARQALLVQAHRPLFRAGFSEHAARSDARRPPVNTGALCLMRGAGSSPTTAAARAVNRTSARRRAGCAEIRKSGSEGSREETTGRKAGIGASPLTLLGPTPVPG